MSYNIDGDFVRLRNVKNKNELLSKSRYVVFNKEDYCGKWNTFFNNNNPIYIEIGMGKGNFIVENALRYPDINFIGIEKSDSILALATKKIPEGLNNLALIRMDASEITSVFKKEISCIYLNFSDPWPKKRHANRRLTSPIFLDLYDSVFIGDKKIIQKTDNRNLFEYSVISLSNYGYIIEDITLDYHNSDYENIIMTEYEQKFSMKGMPIYRLVALKNVSNIKKNK